ncbi:hypothetical protein P7C65_07s2g11690 [Encephalitozoon intestinalis]
MFYLYLYINDFGTMKNGPSEFKGECSEKCNSLKASLFIHSWFTFCKYPLHVKQNKTMRRTE